MAEDDIYGSKARYEDLKKNLKKLLVSPQQNNKRRKYYCRNPENLQYFKQLFIQFEARDLSYVRRVRIIQALKFIVHHTRKNLQELDRIDIDKIMIHMHEAYRSPKSKETFIKEIKLIWKKILRN